MGDNSAVGIKNFELSDVWRFHLYNLLQKIEMLANSSHYGYRAVLFQTDVG